MRAEFMQNKEATRHLNVHLTRLPPDEIQNYKADFFVLKEMQKGKYENSQKKSKGAQLQ